MTVSTHDAQQRLKSTVLSGSADPTHEHERQPKARQSPPLTTVNLTVVQPPPPQQVNIQINKFSALSRHQALKPETHDFLMSLVKKGSRAANPAIHYTNCFNNVQSILMQRARDKDGADQASPSQLKGHGKARTKANRSSQQQSPTASALSTAIMGRLPGVAEKAVRHYTKSIKGKTGSSADRDNSLPSGLQASISSDDYRHVTMSS